jgi:C_GCAxxG_C_C family probable redox protein
MSKKENLSEQAVCVFKEGFSCSQAIFSTYGKEFGIDRATALKISAAFGGGMARMGETCGAVTGAFMVIGLKYAENKDSKEKIYALVKKFAADFKARNGSIVCKELLRNNIGTAEGMKAIKEKNLIKTRCPKLVKDAAEILEEILENEDNPQ